jgi:hypothetical protein
MQEAPDSSDEFAAAQDSSSDDEEQEEVAMQLGNVVTAHQSASGRQGEAHAHSSAPHTGGDDVVQVGWIARCPGGAADGARRGALAPPPLPAWRRQQHVCLSASPAC